MLNFLLFYGKILCYFSNPARTLLAMIANSVVQSATRTLFAFYLVHKHINNVWYNETHSLIGTPCLVTIASHVRSKLFSCFPIYSMWTRIKFFVLLPEIQENWHRENNGKSWKNMGQLTDLEQKQTGISPEVSVNNKAGVWFGQVFLVTRLEHV